MEWIFLKFNSGDQNMKYLGYAAARIYTEIYFEERVYNKGY